MIVLGFFIASFISTLILWSLCHTAKKADHAEQNADLLRRGSEPDQPQGDSAGVLRMRRRQAEIRNAIFRSSDPPNPWNL